MRRLRSGYTTGACAAAAAKAAVHFAVTGTPPGRVEIPFPDSSRHGFTIHRAWQEADPEGGEAFAASVIKDAGDDPDVTNGAEIVALATLLPATGQLPTSRDCLAGSVSGRRAPQIREGDLSAMHQVCGQSADKEDAAPCDRLPRVLLCRGEGVGVVTKRGLAIPPGEPAINPVPRRMITAAALEALPVHGFDVRITISVPGGEALAAKTLNQRLGIIGGLSILGTTGIVRPVSAEAWTATIQASLAVAREAGLREVVLSTGRTSEKGVQQLLQLPEEAYAMMGDYLEFSLTEAGRRGFEHVHLAGMWAKIVKAARQIPQTHVRHGALEVKQAVELLGELGAEPELLHDLHDANTAREIYLRLRATGREELITAVCRRAREYAARTAGVPVTVYLVDSSMKIVARTD